MSDFVNNLPDIISAFGDWEAPELTVNQPWGAVETIEGDVNFSQIGDVNFGSSDILDISDISDVSWDESTPVEDILDVNVTGAQGADMAP